MQNQIYIFNSFILNGILIGILFDIFRVFRKSFKTPDMITYIEDVVFGILSGLLVLFTIMKINNGEIRVYLFIGIILGLILYLLIFSNIFIKVSVYILMIIKKVVRILIIIPTKFICKILKKILFRPIIFICFNIKKILKKIKFILCFNSTKKLKN